MTVTAPLLYDSISRNTGDIAIGIAGQQVLSRMGMPSAVLSPFVPPPKTPVIIGGGELIRESGDEFYDRFRAPGPQILNAAGVWTNARDLDYLNEYHYVSARSTREAEVLSAYVRHVEVLPCTTTMLESADFEIPGVSGDEPLVGIHIAPHAVRFIDELVHVIDAIPHRKVLIPFTHYIDDKSFMEALPINRREVITLGMLKPLEIHAVLRRMKYVLVTSLHASLFSYSQNIPFAAIAQPKVGFYFDDRGLLDHVVGDRQHLVDHLHRLDEDPPDYAERIDRDRVAVTSAYRQYGEILREHGTDPDPWDSGQSSLEVRAITQEVLLEQAHHVVKDRDRTIAVIERRRERSDQRLQALESRLRNRIAARVGSLLRRLRFMRS